MEIRAKCKYDFDSVKALAHLTMFKKANPKKRLTFWAITYAILCIVIILEIVAFGADTILFVLLGVETVGIILMCIGYFITPKMQYKSLAKMKNAENEYAFYDNVIKTSTKSQEYSGEAEIEYSLFVRVYETTKYLFLYQTNNQVFIVDKNTIEGGTIEDIRKKMYTYLKNKYMICKY